VTGQLNPSRRGSYGIDAPHWIAFFLILLAVNAANAIIGGRLWLFVPVVLMLGIAGFNRQAANSPLMIETDRNVQNLIFDTASVNSLTVGTVGGQALLLTAGGVVQTTATVAKPQTVNAPLVLEGDYTFTSAAQMSSSTLSFGGRITPGAKSGTKTLTLNGSNTGANTISGVLADHDSGKLAVTKSGSGVWILSGANTYSGDTAVAGGTLKLDITTGVPTIDGRDRRYVGGGRCRVSAGDCSWQPRASCERQRSSWRRGLRKKSGRGRYRRLGHHAGQRGERSDGRSRHSECLDYRRLNGSPIPGHDRR
jgi:autotransporter-associated beta strand protein